MVTAKMFPFLLDTGLLHCLFQVLRTKVVAYDLVSSSSDHLVSLSYIWVSHCMCVCVCVRVLLLGGGKDKKELDENTWVTKSVTTTNSRVLLLCFTINRKLFHGRNNVATDAL